MSDPHDPGTAEPPELELVSAYLDGEATAEEVARVEGDADLLARAERLRAVGAALAVGEPAGELADAQVTAALDHFAAVPGDAPVVQLAEQRRRRWFDRVPLGAVAAAVVLVALVAGFAQLDIDSGDDTAADAVSEEASTADDGDSDDATLGADAGPAAGGAGSAESRAAERHRLSFATTDELADHVAGTFLAAPEDTTTTFGTAAAPMDEQAEADAEGYAVCDPVGAAGLGGAPLRAVVPAVVAGRDVTAIVVDDEAGTRLVVVDDLDCVVVDDRRLEADG